MNAKRTKFGRRTNLNWRVRLRVWVTQTCKKVLHTGELTIKRINKAMRDIDQVVLKKLGEEAIENPRIYESVNGKMLHGFEIIKVFRNLAKIR